ncbi:uncharacterized protein V1518DRAFT_277450 [Limtongia smithiae]|uniref:uncharacterized protein n=1 Tax=Limtongia smithiae TaxID=1125753 RepID=UPI0034CE1183
MSVPAGDPSVTTGPPVEASVNPSVPAGVRAAEPGVASESAAAESATETKEDAPKEEAAKKDVTKEGALMENVPVEDALKADALMDASQGELEAPKDDAPLADAPASAVPTDMPADAPKEDISMTDAPAALKELSKEAKLPKIRLVAPSPSKNLSPYQPGALVLAKLTGFPPWPGMILSEGVVPAHVLRQKPRRSSNVVAKRKSFSGDETIGGSGDVYAVRFFNDDNYMWASRADLKPLTVDAAARYVENAAAKGVKKDKALVVAYRLAMEGPGEERFAVHAGSDSQEEEDEEDEEEEEEEEEETRQKGKARKSRKRRSEDDDNDKDEEDDDDDEDSSAPKRKKRRASKTPVQAEGTDSTKKVRRSRKSETTSTETQSNGRKKRGPKAATAPVMELTPEQAREEKQKQLLWARHRLQKIFLSNSSGGASSPSAVGGPNDSGPDAMEKYMMTLESFKDLDAAMIRTTKINKVLKLILKLESLPAEEEYHFKERAQALLAAWEPLMEAARAEAMAAAGATASAVAEAPSGETVAETLVTEAPVTETRDAEKPEEKPAKAPVATEAVSV